MAYDPGMIQPKRKHPAAPEIETDPLRIQQLSQEHDDENWEFRSWLKQNAPDNIDGIVKALSHKYFSLIDEARWQSVCYPFSEIIEPLKRRRTKFFRVLAQIGEQALLLFFTALRGQFLGNLTFTSCLDKFTGEELQVKFSVVFLQAMVGPWGLEPQTSTVSR